VNLYPFIEAENAGSGNVTEKIIAVHDESNGTYGTPRIHAELADQGHRHSRKRVARLLRQAGRAGRAPKRWRTTTIPDPAATTPVDLIRRDFSCDARDFNSRWCGDITYINTWEGWLYLATVIDLGSRRVVGWATTDHLRTDLAEQALRNAVTQRRPEPGVIFHSDRGCEYTSGQYARAAADAGGGFRLAARANAGTTRSPSRSSPPSRPSYSTGRPGPRKPRRIRQSSNMSKVGTTPADGIPALATSAPPPTKPPDTARSIR
jgi:transposase InsO family protein